MLKIELDNGLRIVSQQLKNFRSVSFGIWVKAGSRYERAKNNGISHFIEHMLFKGTHRYNAKEIAEIFDGIGGNINAFTSREYTCYYFKVLDEHFPVAVDVLSDMFFDPLLSPSDLSKEKKVILEEISMYEDTPDDMVHDLVYKAAYGDHGLGRPIIGNEDILNSLNSNDLRSFMNDYYTMDQTVISMVGNIDDAMIQKVREVFSGRASSEPSQLHIDPASFTGNRIFHQKNTEQTHMCLSLPGFSFDHELLYAMILFNYVIGGGMSSRLFQEIREDRGLAYSVFSYHSSYIDNGLFTIYAGTAPKQSEEVMKLMLDILQEISQKGISDVELKKGKEQLKGSLIMSLESTNSRMNRMGKNELMLGKHVTIDEMIENIQNVSLEDVNRVIQKTFSYPFAASMVGKDAKALESLDSWKN